MRRLPVAQAVARTVGERVRRGRELPGWLMDPAARLPADVEAWPEDWRFLWDERAGIMEFDGGLTRHDAERDAECLVRAACIAATDRGAAAPR